MQDLVRSENPLFGPDSFWSWIWSYIGPGSWSTIRGSLVVIISGRRKWVQPKKTEKKVLNVLELWEDFLESVPFEEMQIESILYVAFRIKNNFRASFRAIFEPSFLNSFRSSLFTSLFNLINHENTLFHKYSFDCHIFVTFPIQKSQENANFRENSKKSWKFVRIFFFQFKVTWPTSSAKVHFQSIPEFYL